MKWILATGLATVCLAIAAFMIWPMVRVRQLNRAFSAIKDEDSKATVLKGMGNPWKQQECGAYLGDMMPAGCIQELIYAHPYAPYSPEYWVVYLNSSDRVIDHVHLVSP